MDETEDELELIRIVERAERALVEKRNDKFWVTRLEIVKMIFDGAEILHNYEQIGGGHVLEVSYEGITFIHASTYPVITDVKMFDEHHLASGVVN